MTTTMTMTTKMTCRPTQEVSGLGNSDCNPWAAAVWTWMRMKGMVASPPNKNNNNIPVPVTSMCSRIHLDGHLIDFRKLTMIVQRR